MATPSGTTITQEDPTNRKSGCVKDSKSLRKLLKQIHKYTDAKQIEIMIFLAMGLLLCDVSKLNSVSSLYDALACYSRETAIVILQYLLEKASVTLPIECTRQLSSYTTETHNIAQLKPKLYFREMLLRVSQELGSDFVKFRDIVERLLKAHVNNYNSPLAVLQRLIDVKALQVTEESVCDLEQWLVDCDRRNIAQEVVQKYRKTHLQHSNPEFVRSESSDEKTPLVKQHHGEAEHNPTVEAPPRAGNNSSQEQGQSRWKTWCTRCIYICLVLLGLSIPITILIPLYSEGILFSVPSDDVILYNDKPVRAISGGINIFESDEASLTVTKGTLHEGAMITACVLTHHSMQQYIQSRAVNYTHTLTSGASEVRWIAKVGNASDAVDKLAYIIDGSLHYSLDLLNNTNRTGVVTLSLFDNLDTCLEFAEDGSGKPYTNGVSCTRSSTTSVVTYTCDFSKPAYRCAVWAGPPYTNLTYSTIGQIRHYMLGGSNGSYHGNCHSLSATEGDEITVALTDSAVATNGKEKRYLLLMLLNADDYDAVAVAVHLNVRVSTIAFVFLCLALCFCGVAVIALVGFLVGWRCYLCIKARHSPSEPPQARVI